MTESTCVFPPDLAGLVVNKSEGKGKQLEVAESQFLREYWMFLCDWARRGKVAK